MESIYRTPDVLQAKSIIFLTTTDNYDHDAHDPQYHETNQSVVFCVGAFAYKMFKAIKRYRDNTTIQGRLENAKLELSANKKLAGELYLGILAIVRDSEGSIYFASLGEENGREVLDYAIKMKRFPEDSIMYNRLFSGSITPNEMFALGKYMALFHLDQPTVQNVEAFDCHYLIKWANIFRDKSVCKYAKEMFCDIGHIASTVKTNAQEAFSKRDSSCTKIIHGDADFGNIVNIQGKPIPFDAQVVISGGNTADIAKDVCYMLAPLYMYGQPDLAKSLIKGYLSVNPDNTILDILPFGVSYAAMVRGSSWLNRVDNINNPAESARLESCGYRFLRVAQRLLTGDMVIEV